MQSLLFTMNSNKSKTSLGLAGFIALVLILFLSCTKTVNTPPSTFTMLSLGDSYTIGESVLEQDRWSIQLAGMLRQKGLDVGNPDIIARTGWTTDELQTAIRNSNLSGKKYDYVSLLIGVNNQYRGQTLEKYRTEFRQLLQTAVDFANRKPGRVFVLSIPDWGRSSFASGRDKAKISREIDAFNAVAQEESGKAGIVFIDITPISRTAEGDPSQFADDGLHYSGKHMKQWAEKALPVVSRL